MKIFPGLAGSLRFYFGLARALTVLLVAFWLLVLTFGPTIQKLFTDEPKLMVSLGEASLQVAAGAVGLRSDTAKPGSLQMVGLRGSLQADFISKDASLVSALRWTIYPSILVFGAFLWWLFGSLRSICANIEQREVFSEKNLRLVRRIGIIFIAYSLAWVAVHFWAAHVMGGYLSQHVTLTGLETGLRFSGGLGAVTFSLPGGLFPVEGGLVTGCMVLLLTEAFRQGLTLKTENDLTV